MKQIFVAVTVIIALASCNPKQNWEKKNIESKEKILMEQSQKGKVDNEAVKDLLASYESYADKYPSDTTGAVYLFKAADFYRYMREPMRSIAIYRKIYTGYPQIEKHPYALFLQGFIFENEVGNIDSAREKYQQFLTTYPNHPIAKDTKIAMDNLGKTPEQLIREFEERQKADSLARASAGAGSK